MTNIAADVALLISSKANNSLNKETNRERTDIILIKEGSYRLKKCYIVEVSYSFIVRLSKALIARRKCEELISQLLKKSDSDYLNLVVATYNREYKFIIYRAVITISREIFNLLKASIKT